MIKVSVFACKIVFLLFILSQLLIAESSTQYFSVIKDPKSGYNANRGNGFIAFDCGCPSSDDSSSAGSIFLAGLYNGRGSVAPSHRAAIPNPFAVFVEGMVQEDGASRMDHTWEASLDIQRGVFRNASTFTNHITGQQCAITLEWIVHRSQQSFGYLNIRVGATSDDENKRSSANEIDCQFSIKRCSVDEVVDLTIVHHLQSEDVTATLYEVLEAETMQTPPNRVLVIAEEVPSIIRSSLMRSMVVQSTSWHTDNHAVGVADSVWSDNPSAYLRRQLSMMQLSMKSHNWSHVFDTHTAAWASIWESGIEVEGNDTVAAAVNASLYYLLCALDSSVQWSVSPGGLAKNSYNGHVFWDCEMWMMPVTNALFADISLHNFAAYRLQRGQPARLRAAEEGVGGMKLPWESAITGFDVTPTGNIEGDYEIHVTADVALSLLQLHQWTGDDDWLREQAWPMIAACCDYFFQRAHCIGAHTTVSRSTDSADYVASCLEEGGQFTFLSVQPPDEKAGIVNSSVYTNAAAAKLLNWASEVSDKRLKLYDTKTLLQTKYWRLVANNMYIPYMKVGAMDDDAREMLVHAEYEGYDGQPINQADAVLLQYPLRWPMRPLIALDDLSYYANLTSVPGVTRGFYTGDSSYSIAYLDLYRGLLEADSSADAPIEGQTLRDMADEQFRLAFKHIDFTAFNVWHETESGGHLNFLTGAGGFLQNVLYGYAGIRLYSAEDAESSDCGGGEISKGDYMSINPLLPPDGVT